jgi:hypothetical protein
VERSFTADVRLGHGENAIDLTRKLLASAILDEKIAAVAIATLAVARNVSR